eukprot:419884-Rhodomonas_salina.1
MHVTRFRNLVTGVTSKLAGRGLFCRARARTCGKKMPPPAGRAPHTIVVSVCTDTQKAGCNSRVCDVWADCAPSMRLAGALLVVVSCAYAFAPIPLASSLPPNHLLSQRGVSLAVGHVRSGAVRKALTLRGGLEQPSSMGHERLIEVTKEWVKKEIEACDASHDWTHVQR